MKRHLCVRGGDDFSSSCWTINRIFRGIDRRQFQRFLMRNGILFVANKRTVPKTKIRRLKFNPGESGRAFNARKWFDVRDGIKRITIRPGLPNPFGHHYYDIIVLSCIINVIIIKTPRDPHANVVLRAQ